MTSDALGAYTRYFTEFLPGLAGELLIEDLSTLTASFEIGLRDLEAPAWQVSVKDGRIDLVRQSGLDPKCRFEVDSSTFSDVVSARLGPQDAFFDNLIDIKGDLELGLKLSTVLEPFFRRFPF